MGHSLGQSARSVDNGVQVPSEQSSHRLALLAAYMVANSRMQGCEYGPSEHLSCVLSRAACSGPVHIRTGRATRGGPEQLERKPRAGESGACTSCWIGSDVLDGVGLLPEGAGWREWGYIGRCNGGGFAEGHGGAAELGVLRSRRQEQASRARKDGRTAGRAVAGPGGQRGSG